MLNDYIAFIRSNIVHVDIFTKNIKSFSFFCCCYKLPLITPGLNARLIIYYHLTEYKLHQYDHLLYPIILNICCV